MIDHNNIVKSLALDSLTTQEQLEVLAGIEKTIKKNFRAQRTERVKSNVDVVISLLKKIEADIKSRYDAVGNKIEQRVASIKDGRDGRDGKDGKDGKPGPQGPKGDRGSDGKDGKDGVPGQDGISVTDAKIDFDGSLVITLSNGREINVGEVVSTELAEKIKVTMSTNAALTVQDEGSTLTSGARTINFTGSGVTATASGDEVTVNITGGGGSPFTSPVQINVDSTSDALAITQIGTGNALLVEDSSSPDSSPTVIDASGNVILGKTSRTSATSNALEISTTSTGVGGLAPSIGIYNYSSSTSANVGGYLTFTRFPSGTVGTQADARAGDILGTIQFNGSYGGLTFNGRIRATFASDLASVNLFYSGNSHSFSGPITSGTWNGTAIGVAYGGTGLTSGTSGGVLYYSASGTLASSGVLAANAIVLGGGAGATPATTTTGSGVVTAIGNAVDAASGLTTTTGTATLTNKRINPRVTTPGATSGNFTANGDTTDVFDCFGLTGAITFLTPSGTPVNGQRLMIRIEDNGSARGITWTTSSGAFRAVGVTLPSTTTASKIIYVGCVYNSTDIFWDVVAVATQA